MVFCCFTELYMYKSFIKQQVHCDMQCILY